MSDLPAMRERVVARLDDEGRPDLADALRACGEGFEMLCRGCGTARAAQKQCLKRWCPVCARRMAADRVDTYQSAIDSMQWPMMVTLTMPHTADTSCPSDVRALRRALGRLRRLRWFRTKVRGGITSIEITCGANGWHPHAHLVIDCRWLSVQVPSPPYACGQRELQRLCKAARAEVGEQWRLCLRAEQRVQVAISRARPEAAREVLKYSVKAADLVETSLPLAPLLDILKVSRLMSAWGSVRRYKLDRAETDPAPALPSVTCTCGCNSWVPDFVDSRQDSWRIERTRQPGKRWPLPWAVRRPTAHPTRYRPEDFDAP
jgi:hypothetical protein